MSVYVWIWAYEWFTSLKAYKIYAYDFEKKTADAKMCQCLSNTSGPGPLWLRCKKRNPHINFVAKHGIFCMSRENIFKFLTSLCGELYRHCLPGTRNSSTYASYLRLFGLNVWQTHKKDIWHNSFSIEEQSQMIVKGTFFSYGRVWPFRIGMNEVV